MIQSIFLDSGPLGLLTHPKTSSEVVGITTWIKIAASSGIRVVVPAVVYYELRRELLRANKIIGIQRLDAFVNAGSGQYLPLQDQALRLAAELWAQSRREGRPTAPPTSLDIDVILAAQALTCGLPTSEIVIATSNRRHLSQFIDARPWTDIHPY